MELVLRRLASAAVVLVGVSLVVFVLVLLVPGDPAVRVAGESASAEQVEAVRTELGLDRPWYEQYREWVGSAVRGDLGSSLVTEQPVTDAILQRLPATISLTAAALLLAVAISVPAGILAAVSRGRILDRVVSVITSLGVAVPSFWLGLLLITHVASRFDFLPSSRYVPFGDSPSKWAFSLVLPAIALGLAPAAEITRQVRSAMVDSLGQDYVRTARAKGLRPSAVVGRHALRNAAVPVVTVIGIQVTLLLSTAVIVEQVFSFQGLGTLAYQAATDRDIPMILGVVVFATLVVTFVNIAVDLSYVFLNPKVRAR